MKQINFTFTNFAGKEIAGYKWEPESGEPKACFLIIHGLAEHCKRYGHFASFLNSNGYAVLGFDHAGHGNTDPDNTGHINTEDSFHYMVKTINDFINTASEFFPGLTQILFAHSMGSFLTQRYFQMYENNESPAAVIYSGSNGKPPAILQGGIWISSLLRKINGPETRSPFLSNLIFGKYIKPFRPTRTPFDWLSRDEQQVDKYINDPHCGFVCSTSFYNDFFKGLKALHSHKPFAGSSTEMPILLLSGDSDPVSDMGKGIHNLEKLLINSGAAHVQKKLYPGGRHEMLNEINRDEVMRDVLEFVEISMQ